LKEIRLNFHIACPISKPTIAYIYRKLTADEIFNLFLSLPVQCLLLLAKIKNKTKKQEVKTTLDMFIIVGLDLSIF